MKSTVVLVVVRALGMVSLRKGGETQNRQKRQAHPHENTNKKWFGATWSPLSVIYSNAQCNKASFAKAADASQNTDISFMRSCRLIVETSSFRSRKWFGTFLVLESKDWTFPTQIWQQYSTFGLIWLLYRLRMTKWSGTRIRPFFRHI